MLILRQARCLPQAITHTKGLGLSDYVPGCGLQLDLDACLGRSFGREHDAVQIEITIRATQVLHLETLHMDALHQPLPIGIQGIQRIDGVMLGLVCGGIVEHEQRMKALDTRLCRISLHLLWLIHDDDRSVSGDHVNGTAAAKLIPFGIDDAALLAPSSLLHRGGEGLGIDDHDAQLGFGGETIQLLQVAAVIDEPTHLLVVVLHEMILQHGEALGHTLPDGDAGHHDDELPPAILLIQLKHRLDIDIGLSRSGLHLDVEVQCAYSFHQALRRGDVTPVLDCTDLLQQGLLVQLDTGVAIARLLLFIMNLLLLLASYISAIGSHPMRGLTGKDVHGVLHRLRLVLLDFKLEFHFCLLCIEAICFPVSYIISYIG